MSNKLQILSLAALASCTAINQKDVFLDDLTAKKPVVVFTEDFENGLGNWTQSSLTAGNPWTTGTPAASGAALISPSTTSGNTFSIATINNIDLSKKSNCVLQYEIRYNISGVSGVTAQVLFGNTVVGSYKEQNTGLAAVSSGLAFQTKKYLLPDSSSEKLTIRTVAINNTTSVADIMVDNMSVTCGVGVSGAVTLVTENFESGAPNWTPQSPLGIAAGQGLAGSNAGGGTLPDAPLTYYITYSPNISLVGRSGCRLRYYFRVGMSQTTAADCISLDWNTGRIDVPCTATITGYRDVLLTPYEGSATNSLQVRASESAGYAGSPSYYIDDVSLSCQQ